MSKKVSSVEALFWFLVCDKARLKVSSNVFFSPKSLEIFLKMIYNIIKK